MAVTTCFLNKIHYLTDEEKEIIPKIIDLLLSKDYESQQLGIGLFLEIFGIYYMSRFSDDCNNIKSLCDYGTSSYRIWNILQYIKYITSRAFVYERCYY